MRETKSSENGIIWEKSTSALDTKWTDCGYVHVKRSSMDKLDKVAFIQHFNFQMKLT